MAGLMGAEDRVGPSRRGRPAGGPAMLLVRVLAAGLAVALLGALAAGGATTLRAQDSAPDIAQLRQVIAVRDAQGAGRAEETIAAAQAYLAEYPQGRYADEVLLALAQGHAEQEHPELALQAYNRLIEEFPESPFREQAMSESLPLLAEQDDEAAAFQRVDALVEAYPNSLRRSEALLWKARNQHGAADHEGTLATLERIDPEEDLAREQEADYYRLQTLALVRDGRSAWTPLQRYLQRDDTPEHKAEVLLLVGEIARNAERPDEALRFYRQVVEDYPVPGALNEALYWRAELFARTRLGDAPEEVRAARRETAIGYFSGYLGTGDDAYRAQALVGRGRLHRDAGRLEQAVADFEAAVAQNKVLRSDPEVVREQVELYRELGRPQAGVALLESIRGDESLTSAERTAFQVQQAALHYEAEECEAVEAMLNPMPIVPDPEQRSRAFFMRGFCRYQRGEWEKATFDLEGLINDPAYQELALEPLLEAYEKSGQTSRLVNLAEELLQAGRVEPSATLLMRLANGYAELGEPALMLSAYQRLEAEHPEAARAPVVQLRMGQARERLGQPAAAIAHYRAVLEQPPPDEPPAGSDAAPEDGPRAEADAAPEDVYLTALERLQALLVARDELEPLLPLHEAAGAVVTSEAGEARLTALARDLDVALARRALEGDDPAQAVERLQAALEETPPEQPERRARTAALLMTAHARTGAPDEAVALYQAEREGHEEDGYRATLASSVIAAVQGQPKALEDAEQRQALTPVYRQAVTDLPAEQAERRYEAAQALDALYRQDGEHAARASLVKALLKDGFDDETKEELRRYQGRIYKEWGQALVEEGDLEAAEFQLQRSMALLTGAEWRERYEVASALGRVQLERGAYSDLIVMNEALLPEIEDKALAAQLRHFLGQVYVQWGKVAEENENPKSARIRYAYALDYLPDADWQRRLAATNGLAKVLQAQGRAGDAAAAYEEVLPQIENADVRQQYALYVGRLYAEQADNPEKASHWLKRADRGGADALSLEAGYLWADQQLALERADAALTRLKELTTRDLSGTKWQVPIHYRLAVLHHQRKELKDALAHYRVVAGVQQADVRQLYPRSIAQSREQAERIEDYLNTASGGDIAVPKVQPE